MLPGTFEGPCLEFKGYVTWTCYKIMHTPSHAHGRILCIAESVKREALKRPRRASRERIRVANWHTLARCRAEDRRIVWNARPPHRSEHAPARTAAFTGCTIARGFQLCDAAGDGGCTILTCNAVKHACFQSCSEGGAVAFCKLY